jgi:hypothetical protein
MQLAGACQVQGQQAQVGDADLMRFDRCFSGHTTHCFACWTVSTVRVHAVYVR